MNLSKQFLAAPTNQIDALVQAGATVHVFDGTNWVLAKNGVAQQGSFAIVETSDPNIAQQARAAGAKLIGQDNPWPVPRPKLTDSLDEFVASVTKKTGGDLA